MHRPLNKNAPQRQHVQSFGNKNNGHKIVSQPKNGKNCTQPIQIEKVTEEKPVSN